MHLRPFLHFGRFGLPARRPMRSALGWLRTASALAALAAPLLVPLTPGAAAAVADAERWPAAYAVDQAPGVVTTISPSPDVVATPDQAPGSDAAAVDGAPSPVPAEAAAAVSDDAVAHLELLVQWAKSIEAKLGDDEQDFVDLEAALSASGFQLVSLAQAAPRLKRVAAAGKDVGALDHGDRGARPPVHGSDPGDEADTVSHLAGMTQSEPSIAWCGENVVVGFNDSASFVSTLTTSVSPSGSFSFNGWAFSGDGGRSFADGGAWLADPLPSGMKFRDLFGDPVLGCTNSATFYAASLAIDVPAGAGAGQTFSAIAVARSTDGGRTFGGAMVPISKAGAFHVLDKPWMAVDAGPTPGQDVIHITYTDFDFTPAAAGCNPGQLRTAVEYIRSTDGGATWSAPTSLAQTCGSDPFVQGSHVAVGLGNDLYAGWEQYPSLTSPREIKVRKSADRGATFGPAVTVSSVTPVGDGAVMQGNFRTFLDFQGFAVDRSAGPRRGTLYATWHDGRNRKRPDPFGNCGGRFYCFGDVLVAGSTDGGATWSAPVQVSNPGASATTDQFLPAIATDARGSVYVLYYDRRRDPRNFLIDVFLARSDDGGRTWTSERLTTASFPPITGAQDLLINPAYMGDYIGLAGDGARAHFGVVAAWGDNSLGDANVVVDRR